MLLAIALAVLAVAFLFARGGFRPPWRIEWPALGIRLFSWIAGIALALSAVFLFRGAADHGWPPALRAAIGIAIGVALLVICELGVARHYRITANAMDGAGIAILYATFYAMHGRWHIVPLWVAFLGMLAVTVAAVALATRRESTFIALLGLIGGFAIPALLGLMENYPSLVFLYLLLLNVGVIWVASRMRWAVLAAMSVALTTLYQWVWVLQFLYPTQLWLAAVVFLGFAFLWASVMAFPRIAAVAAILPLLLAFQMAAVPDYGAHVQILFGFLLLTVAGLAILAARRGPQWLQTAASIATLITFYLWVWRSYAHPLWPWPLVWLAVFIVFELVRHTPFAPLLFTVFIGLAIREPKQYATLIVVMLVLLAIVLVATLRRGVPLLGVAAIAFSSIAVMALQAPLWPLLVAHAALFTALLAVAWIAGRYELAVLAIPFYVAVIITAHASAVGAVTPVAYTSPHASFVQYPLAVVAALLAVALVPYVLFLAFALALGERAKGSLAPYLAAALASVGLILSGRNAFADAVSYLVSAQPRLDESGYAYLIDRWSLALGLLALAEGLVFLVLLWRMVKVERGVTLVASAALAFLNGAIPLLLPKPWTAVVWSVEAVALAWLFMRFRYRVLLVWSVGLAAVLFFWLPGDADVYRAWYAFLAAAAAMFCLAYFSAVRRLQLALSLGGLIMSFFLVNVIIANIYHSTGGALNISFSFASPAEDLTYTIAWAVIAASLLFIGLAFHWEGARVGALSLLVAATLKCFAHDTLQLDGSYRVASLAVVAASLVFAGLLLQRFTMRVAEVH